ncbi:HAD hydrolase-like protein [Bradyrhizobium sp. B124]|uniref:HAD family hydrolase n=1 Tax=Bradyrhizobium sp. B124 TaxID=3140245 RepID=UPI0031830B7E
MPFSYETFQLYSGLNGDETLKLVTPSFKEDERKQMLKDAGKYYEQTYLPLVRPFEGVRALFTAIKQSGGAIAFATDCKGAPLKVYRGLLGVDDLVDYIACGDDIPKGKPDPAVIDLAVKELGLPAGRCVMTGDTPYDCAAAAAGGVTAMGLLSGGFARDALLEAGAIDVLEQIAELEGLFFDEEKDPHERRHF